MTQTEAIRAHLKRGRKITAVQALAEFGCLRLAARIDELRKSGESISVERVTTRSGKHVAQYRMGA